ncbi:class II glutamine amidotransferase [Actinobacillus pleuropneumoniae]|uniref:Class II glutamine amidotransferase n=1 Tax=Actinobacillus pleuropneumoniae TaxID=715 RepID=A0A9Q4DGJ1_ACTPL|nr:class II glutamine amidotransferase [Actinobacillus pleuropneumoniae]EFM90432.1 glutamine amidotransferase [Actinobacillus pleuropneumoniae serovar 4 str. M62]MCL7720179.1 class II glutamine amidotransferase [Actinobacillus pleuropneumoniae]MCL7727695.1 class II glutamine amidotransferase [Actinobacillus pleuropneumoniae]MCL7728789.1 class II glutamine amidotransferase [Actinobacillus pleuropneumoniae]MCY6367351.1 class II glutamine amidotransferase [Actinobacillus pleuropneumoniae]
MCQLLGMNCNTPTDITFSFEGFRRRAGVTDQHTDGFGIAFFEGKGVRIFRDNRPGASSPMADLVGQYHIKSFNVIAHIRKATRGDINLENTHPFIRELWGENWVFAHNGTVEGVGVCEECHYQPIGTTDSEVAFCCLVSQLRERFLKKPSEKEIFDAVVEITSEIAKHGVFNFILSNGHWMIARCSTNLHYVTRKAPFSTALRDDDVEIDFSKYTTANDKVTIITTQPLTKNEKWVKMKNGGYAFFKNGDLIEEIEGTLPEQTHV